MTKFVIHFKPVVFETSLKRKLDVYRAFDIDPYSVLDGIWQLEISKLEKITKKETSQKE